MVSGIIPRIPPATCHAFSRKAATTRYIETRECRVPRMLPCGIFVIRCPPAEHYDENSEHFTSSKGNASLNFVPCRFDVSSPDSPSDSLRGRMVVEDPDLQQLRARGQPAHNRA